MIRGFIKRKLINFLIHLDNDTKSKLYQTFFNAYNKEKYQNYREKYELDKGFKFNGDFISFYGDGRIICGKKSYIGNFSTLLASPNCKIVIGDYCSISHNVRIYTGTKVADQNFITDNLKQKKFADVIIGNGVWIGANVFINPGVIIGDNSIIGANSVVTQNVEENSIVGGVPAKLIRMKSYKDVF